MGTALRTRIPSLALAAAVWASSVVPSASDSHPFTLHRGHLVLVQGSVGSASDLVFLLDTGSGRTLLSTAVGATLRLDGTPTVLWSFGRRLDAVDAVVPELAAGGFRIGPLRVLVTDMAAVASSLDLPRLDGILGIDVLRTRSFGLDFAGRLVRFGDPPPLRYRASLTDHPFLLVLSADLDGQAVRLAVDTGASHLVSFATVVTGQGVTAADLSGRTSVSTRQVGRLRIGNWEARHVIAVTASLGTGPNTRTDGVIGIGPLGASLVWFDFAGREITWNP